MHLGRTHKPKQLEDAHLSAKHTCLHLPFCLHLLHIPRPVHQQRIQPHGQGSSGGGGGGTLPVHSYALSHEYKLSHVSRQISHCQWLILLRSRGLAYSSEPTQEPWGREAVPVSCWHSQGRVREPSPDPEQVALQLCPGWPCQLAHPLGQAWKAQGSLLGPRVRLPIGGGTSYWGMGQWKSCVRQAEALCMSMSLSSGSHLIHLGKDAGGPVTWFFNLNSLLNTPTPKGSWQLGLQFNNQMTQLAQ